MPQLTNYVAIRDNPVIVAAGAPQILGFNLPAGVQANDAILFFVARTAAVNVQFNVQVNAAAQAAYAYNDAELHSVHEVVNGLVVGANTVTFAVTAGGPLTISDVVLYFRF